MDNKTPKLKTDEMLVLVDQLCEKAHANLSRSEKLFAEGHRNEAIRSCKKAVECLHIAIGIVHQSGDGSWPLSISPRMRDRYFYN